MEKPQKVKSALASLVCGLSLINIFDFCWHQYKFCTEKTNMLEDEVYRCSVDFIFLVYSWLH